MPPIDERCTWGPPDNDDNNLLFEQQDVRPRGDMAPPLYGRFKSLKSLDFDGVLRGRTSASHTAEDTGREGHGKDGSHGEAKIGVV